MKKEYWKHFKKGFFSVFNFRAYQLNIKNNVLIIDHFIRVCKDLHSAFEKLNK